MYTWAPRSTVAGSCGDREEAQSPQYSQHYPAETATLPTIHQTLTYSNINIAHNTANIKVQKQPYFPQDTTITFPETTTLPTIQPHYPAEQRPLYSRHFTAEPTTLPTIQPIIPCRTNHITHNTANISLPKQPQYPGYSQHYLQKKTALPH
jgi:hypothetical protein